MKPVQLEDMIQDGCTERFARLYYEDLVAERESANFDEKLTEYAHKMGFCAGNVAIYDLENNRLDEYLTDYDYYKTWPHNNWTRIWINDKLTLKYIMDGTDLSDLMPEYYFYTDAPGVRVLPDGRKYEQSVKGILNCIREKGNIACKPNNGVGGNGFYKLSYRDGYYIDDKLCTEDEIEAFILGHTNYIFTEFLFPMKELAPLSDNKIHTLRVMILNRDGISPKMVGSYFRFATKDHGTKNVSNFDGECSAMYNIVADINLDTGYFGNTKAVYCNKQIPLEKHPDTGVEICGQIPDWQEKRNALLETAKLFFGIEWMGIDACIDQDGKLRIMEINTFPGLRNAQLHQPLLKDPDVKAFFDGLLKKIDEAGEDKKENRRKIQR